MRAPIELELYNEENEVVKKLSRLIVPWGLLKKSSRIAKRLGKMNAEEISESEEVVDELTELVVEIFGEKNVTIAELDECADIGDMIAVVKAISERAKGLIPNAPPAAQ